MKTILLTAGLGNRNYSDAAYRLCSQGTSLFEFSDILVLNNENFSSICPISYEICKRYRLEDAPGFGYWCWKPELIHAAINGKFGNFDQVIWMDSGCEVNPNYISRRTFEQRIYHTQRYGFWLHALKSSDLMYTKSLVISQFPELNREQIESFQFQANYMHFSSEKAATSVDEWFTVAKDDIENLTLGTADKESPYFIEHRSDQSILSMVLKRRNIYCNRIDLPSGRSTRSAIRGVFEPVWISRNRGGKSIVPRFIASIP